MTMRRTYVLPFRSDSTATPLFSPGSGTYIGTQTITVTCATPGSSIYYTTDGTTPTYPITGSTQLYTTPLTVTVTETINAIGIAMGYGNSPVGQAVYTITSIPQTATPTFNPAAGSYGATQNVAIACTTAGAQIYYAINATASPSSTLYVNPIAVASSETLSAIAVASGYANSNVANAAYTITGGGGGTVATPTFSPYSQNYEPAQVTYGTTQSVTISCATAGATINYTTDGSTPGSSPTSQVYTAPISVTTETLIKAAASLTGYTSSSIAWGWYTIQTLQAAEPTMAPLPGTYAITQSVALSCATSGASIYYTTNGSTPTTSSTLYTGTPVNISSTTTLKAIAALAGIGNSVVAAGVYQIGLGSELIAASLYTQSIAMSGTQFVNSSGKGLTLRGVNLGGLADSAAQGKTPDWQTGGKFAPQVANAASWGATHVRVPLNAASFLGLTCYLTTTVATVNFTSAPTFGSTGGTLTANWTLASGTYPVTFNGNGSPLTAATFTNGSTAVTWTTLDETGNNANSPGTACNVIGWGTSRNADYNGTYRSSVQSLITTARANNLLIIFDCHWTSPQLTIAGVTNYLMPLGQSPFLDTTAQTFWSTFYSWLVTNYGAGNFQDIIFELYNEPYLNQNGYILTTTQGGSTSVSADLALKNGGWSSCTINWTQGGSTNYVLGLPWQVIGYQTIANSLIGAGCTNMFITNGNSYAQQLQNYTTWQITDSRNNTAIGLHPYGAGSPSTAGVYPNGNVWPRIGNDSNGNTNLAFEWANAIISAGYPVFITEDGGIAGTDVTSIPYEAHMATMQQWAASNNMPYTAWDMDEIQAYGTATTSNRLTVLNASGTAALPIGGEGVQTNKWMTRAKAPMNCITRTGYYGQATSGSTSTCVDTLQNWLTNQWVGYVFFDNFTGASSNIVSNTANTLTFGTISAAVSAGDGYSIITNQLVPYVTAGGQNPASYVTDPSGNHAYNSVSSPPVYFAYDLSAKVSAGLSAILMNWYNDGTYNFDAYLINPGNNYYNCPGSYTIDINTAAGGTLPTSGWQTVYTFTNNTYSQGQHYVNLQGANWVRMNVTFFLQAQFNQRVALKCDLYDASYGVTDGLFIAGDSITANGMGHSASYADTISNYAAGQLGTQTSTPSSLGVAGYYNGYPLPYLNGGMAGWNTTNYVGVFSQFMLTYPGLYVGISLGTNDLPTLSGGTATYTTNMTTMINDILALGKIPLLATMPYCTDSQHQAGFPYFWGPENSLLALTGVVAGPNFRKFFYGYVGSSGFTAVSNSGGTSTVTDTTQTWAVNVHQGLTLNNLTRGTVSSITSNTAHTITFSTPGTAPQGGDVYNLSYQNYTATGGSTTTLTDTTQSWPVNLYQYSYVCNITRGTYAQVLSNTAQTLNVAAMSTANQSGDVYSLNGQNMVTSGIDGSDGLHPGNNGRRGQRMLWAQAIAAAGVT